VASNEISFEFVKVQRTDIPLLAMKKNCKGRTFVVMAQIMASASTAQSTSPSSLLQKASYRAVCRESRDHEAITREETNVKRIVEV
jgi:hypothetical protein